MPFSLFDTNCFPIVIDEDFEVVNKDLLAEYIGELVLGHHNHILKVINSLATNFPVHPNDSINHVIKKLQTTSIEKRDGWLFQMISWIVLSTRNTENNFFSNYPHFAPAQHGIDGLAIVLNDDNTLNKIIITEDKCTINPRNKIQQQVFPEFREFENGEKNNALISIISSLLGQIDSGRVLENIQNDIFKNEFRVYRIGINREERHNSIEGRNGLFAGYDQIVEGDDNNRRTAATIHLNEMRIWMNDLAEKVTTYLNSKLN